MFVKLKKKVQLRRARAWIRQSLVYGWTFAPNDLMERFNVSESDLDVLSVRTGALLQSRNRLQYVDGKYRPYGDFAGKIVFPAGGGEEQNPFLTRLSGDRS